MNRVILIKYGELTTKKGNRKFFINTLYKNINDKLKGYDVKISKDISRMYIEFMDKDLDKILNLYLVFMSIWLLIKLRLKSLQLKRV